MGVSSIDAFNKEITTKAVRLVEDRTESIVLTDDCFTLDVSGDVTVKANVPIVCNTKCVVIKGEGSLHLVATEFMQPCIGSETHTGMSYGRWSSDRCKCKQIIVDGARVECESLTPNFSIGAYNYETYPEVTCKNGGELVCPETSAKRILKTKAYAPEGSTKISTTAEYILEGQDPFSDVQKKLIAEIVDIAPKWKGKIDFRVTPEFLKKALALLRINPDCNIDMLINGKHPENSMICRTMCVLNLPDELWHGVGLFFEINKLQYLGKDMGFDFEGSGFSAIEVCEAVHRKYGDDFSKLSDWQIEEIYEIIPSYSFEFEHGVPHRVNAEKFFNLIS